MTGYQPDPVSWLRVLFAIAVVSTLLGLLGFALRHINARGIKLPTRANRPKRVELVESLALDLRRRLVIVRWDDREHLLLLGADRDIVVAAADSTTPTTPPAA